MASPRQILVRVTHSCISVGTEMAGVRASALPLYRRALQQPENVKRVIDMAREQGIRKTIDRVSGKLAAGSPTGYSVAGTVTAVGEGVVGFAPGDRVACAGAGIANHAEFVDVPVNLAVRVPDDVDLASASTVTLGAIALQGVRRAAPTLGETVVVVGLGILGQLTVQFLAANGCRVIGVDPDAARVALAARHGMDFGVDPTQSDYPDRVRQLTDGFGADAVIVTAASGSDEIISLAFGAARKKSRVVLVGDVGLNLKRSDIYAKEIDFLVSCSYGPGRYDSVYELEGRDYPLPYVRWTENRNMSAYLDLVDRKRIDVAPLVSTRFPLEKATEAFSALRSDGPKPLSVILEYPSSTAEPARRVAERRPPAPGTPGRLGIGILGAGSFVQGMHLPNIAKLRDQLFVQAVMSRTGANAKAVATQYEAAYSTTDVDEVLADPAVEIVIIATRHDLHAALALKALNAGKHVLVEKPLALSEAGVAAIEAFYADNPGGPILLTGFNRRFAPCVARIRQALADRASPLIVDYRMNAGHIPVDHWVHGVEGGGRNIGEACHIYDLFLSLAGSEATSVTATAIRPQSAHWSASDNFTATVSFADGSICTLTYTALGARGYPKERMEVFASGMVLSLDDYRSATIVGASMPGWSGATDKGHFDMLRQLAAGVAAGQWPITLADQLAATRLSLAVETIINPAAAWVDRNL
jgi:predicted dehydrogenase